MVVEHGEIDLVHGKTAHSVHLKVQGSVKPNSIEKNWVMFEDSSNALKMVYGWQPLQIGTVIEDQFVGTHSLTTPYFFRFVRGSTNGIRIGDEIWFLCHIVNYEDRRYYYEIFVVLDARTYQLKKYSCPVTFEGQKVEYSLGLLYLADSNEFMIGYSLYDRETKYMLVNKDKVDSLIVVIS
jgi:hypothetical protein